MLNDKELLFVVDEQNQPLAPKPRNEVHKKGYWHRNSHIWVRNYDQQVLCQERSLKKDTNPGLWEPFFGGHVLAEEGYLSTAIKECEEELDLLVTDENLKLFKIFKSNALKEFIAVYGLRWNGNLREMHLEEDEVTRVKWFDIDEVRQMVCVEKKPTWNIMGYEEEVLGWLSRWV